MRIKLFRYFVDEIAEAYELKETPLVIDAQNFFYDCYKDSDLRYDFGAECDRYAKYLKDMLSTFKKANIECYFIFKGGTMELGKKIQKVKSRAVSECNSRQNNLDLNSVFVKDIHVQVLKEMEFNFFFSEYESKADCMTLARKLSCPVLSEDIEFALSGVKYISKRSLRLGKEEIHCKLFHLESFLQKYNLNKKKLAFFILLTDETIFPEKTFDRFFHSRRIPIPPRYRNVALLDWLSKSSEMNILKDIRKNSRISEEEIHRELNKANKIVEGKVNSEVATNYFFNKDIITDWFVSGVATNYIAKDYIDLYRSNVLLKEFKNADDFMKLSLSIIKYAYDILTDFENDGLKLVCFYYDKTSYETILIRETTKKPSCLAKNTISETDWDNVSSLGLFQHFISEEIHFDCVNLETVPDDAKMLMITLLYIYHNSQTKPNITTFTTEMAYGVLLSYVMLSVVNERVDNVRDDNIVSISDCESALHTLKDYFKVENANTMMDKNLLLSLKQFQFCLSQMNNLNKLCGSPFEPTIYRKTYNSTFVYMVLSMEREDILVSLNRMLSCAPSVLSYFNDIVGIYETCCNQIPVRYN